MHVGAAEVFRAHHLAGRRLHQRRAAEEDGALVLDDDGLVRHRRHIGAARGARAHHDGDLRDAHRRQRGLVIEDAAEMLAVGEDFRLVRQVGAATVDEIEARQPVLARDLLGAQVLLHRHRVIGAAFDGRVVGDDHAFAALDAADAGDEPGAVDGVVVETVGGERRQLQERRAGIDQVHHALARQQLTARHMPLAGALGPAQRGLGAALLQFLDKRAHALGVGAEFARVHIDGGRQNRQAPLPGLRYQRALTRRRRQWRPRCRHWPAAWPSRPGSFFEIARVPGTRHADARCRMRRISELRQHACSQGGF